MPIVLSLDKYDVHGNRQSVPVIRKTFLWVDTSVKSSAL